MVVFPNAKINIGLYVTDKRVDGFHNISSIFLPVPWCDIVEALPNQTNDLHFSSSGLEIPGSTQHNLCVQAWHLLNTNYGPIQGFDLHLHKVIPMGAGMGGGSSDGAFTLKLLSQLLGLDVDTATLKNLALQLGSDCPFFINNSSSLAAGRGEILTPISLNLTGYQLLIINPGIHIATPWAFSQISPKPASFNLNLLPNLPIKQWKNKVENVFESAAIRTHPAIGQWKNYLYQHGAIYASMTGSGSTLYGIFAPDATLPKPLIAEQEFSYSCVL